jgi:hypothetical protein
MDINFMFLIYGYVILHFTNFHILKDKVKVKIIFFIVIIVNVLTLLHFPTNKGISKLRVKLLNSFLLSQYIHVFNFLICCYFSFPQHFLILVASIFHIQ